jgi:hypothetical protein
MATVGEIDRPKTIKGKSTVSQNAFKGGWREQMRELAKVLREQVNGLEGV